MAQPFTKATLSPGSDIKVNLDGGFLVVAFKNKTTVLILLGFVLGRNSWECVASFPLSVTTLSCHNLLVRRDLTVGIIYNSGYNVSITERQKASKTTENPDHTYQTAT